MKKKYLVTTVAMLAAVSMLAACGNKNDKNDTDVNTSPSVTVAPTTAPTEAPSSDERGDGPSTPVPTETPAAEVDHAQMLQNIHQALKETYGPLYLADTQMQEQSWYMQDTLGLDPSWYDVAIAEIPGMSFGVDKFIIVHPTEGNLENVQNALKNFSETQITEAHQYPANLTKLQAAAVETIGDYVCYMIFTGSVGDVMFEDDAAAIQAYTEANQMAKQIVAAVVSGELVVEPWTELDKMRNEIVRWYGTTYYPNIKVQDDEAYLATYLADTLKMDAAWVDEIIIEVPMISANVDTLILVDPSEGNAENVLAALTEYKRYLVEESFQYPMNEARVQSAVVQQVGDYVCFSILGGALDNPEDMGINGDDVEQMVSYYESMNMNAVYAMQYYLGVEE